MERYQVRKDLQSTGVEEEWYDEARRSRVFERTLYRIGMQEGREEIAVRMPAVSRDVTCKVHVCGRSFRREGDKRHKCVDERRKPVNEQLGAIHCGSCKKWFRTKGGLAVCTCRPSS